MTLSGRIALITGATSGIGLHTALGLARLGATVHVTGRNAESGAAAQARIRTATGNEDVHFLQADASTVGANQELAEHLRSRTDRLDILVNNVGGTYNDRRLSADGYEATLAMNFVGPFALTQALMPLLRCGDRARIVNLASAAIGMVRGDPFTDLHCERRFLGSEAYGRAKLLNVLWTFALARRLAASGMAANALHPGLVWTSMTRSIEPRSMPVWARVAWPLVRWMQRRGSPEDGAATPIFLASAPGAAGITGTYFDAGRPATVPPVARDETAQERAWALGATLVREAPTTSTAMEVEIA